MTRRPRPALPPVDTWALISDGIEGPLLAGLRRGIKHLDSGLGEEEVAHVVETQRQYLMNWFSDTFRFPGDKG